MSPPTRDPLPALELLQATSRLSPYLYHAWANGTGYCQNIAEIKIMSEHYELMLPGVGHNRSISGIHIAEA